MFSLALYAKPLSNYVTLGLSYASLHESANGFNIGYGFYKVSDNSFCWGLAFEYESAKIDKNAVNGFSADLHIGMAVSQRVNIFAIGGALTQNALDTTAYGFGTGLGASVALQEHFELTLHHKLYNMTNKFQTYNYKSSSVNLRYKF